MSYDQIHRVNGIPFKALEEWVTHVERPDFTRDVRHLNLSGKNLLVSALGGVRDIVQAPNFGLNG